MSKGMSKKIRLKFFDAEGNELDTVIIHKSGNSANVPARAMWVEVTTIDEEKKYDIHIHIQEPGIHTNR